MIESRFGASYHLLFSQAAIDFITKVDKRIALWWQRANVVSDLDHIRQ